MSSFEGQARRKPGVPTRAAGRIPRPIHRSIRTGSLAMTCMPREAAPSSLDATAKRTHQMLHNLVPCPDSDALSSRGHVALRVQNPVYQSGHLAMPRRPQNTLRGSSRTLAACPEPFLKSWDILLAIRLLTECTKSNIKISKFHWVTLILMRNSPPWVIDGTDKEDHVMAHWAKRMILDVSLLLLHRDRFRRLTFSELFPKLEKIHLKIFTVCTI